MAVINNSPATTPNSLPKPVLDPQNNSTPSPPKPSPPSKKHHLQNATQPHPKRRRRAWAELVEELALANGIEQDEHRLAQRQKQIDYGKNTLAYDQFNKILPREKRVKGDPMTPIIRQKCSKRSFMGQVTSWKKKVYAFVKALDEVREEGKGNKDGDVKNGEKHVSEKDAVDIDDDVDDDDDPLKDMEDIQLDDLGNVIKPTEPTHTKTETTICKEQNTPPSIFDAF